MSRKTPARQRVVILGGGFAGLAAALELQGSEARFVTSAQCLASEVQVMEV